MNHWCRTRVKRPVCAVFNSGYRDRKSRFGMDKSYPEIFARKRDETDRKILENSLQKSCLALLYVNGQDQPFDKMKFKRELREFDNKIIECKFDFQQHTWTFMRERRDKSFPNHVSTAVAVCNSIKFPVRKENLLQIIDQIKHGNLRRRDRESMNTDFNVSAAILKRRLRAI